MIYHKACTMQHTTYATHKYQVSTVPIVIDSNTCTLSAQAARPAFPACTSRTAWPARPASTARQPTVRMAACFHQLMSKVTLSWVSSPAAENPAQRIPPKHTQGAQGPARTWLTEHQRTLPLSQPKTLPASKVGGDISRPPISSMQWWMLIWDFVLCSHHVWYTATIFCVAIGIDFKRYDIACYLA